MTELVWDATGARYYETGVSRGIFFPISGAVGVVWNGLVSMAMDPQGGELEQYWFDGVKYMDRILAEDFQATMQTISTPKEFEACEGIKTSAEGVKTSFNKRDKFHMSWRTEIGNDLGLVAGYKLHIAYNCLAQPSSRNYQTVGDTQSPDTRTFVITATPACGRDSYFWFDSREYDLSALETQLKQGILPKCWELGGLITPLDPDAPGVDPDSGCPSILEDFNEYFPGQLVNEAPKVSGDDTMETYIYGKINNGLDVITLPANGTFAANDSLATEVGTGTILDDDDDATYVTSADGDLGYTYALPQLVGYVPGCRFELHIRMSISGDVSEDDPDNIDADAQVHISTDAGGDITVGGFSDGTDEGMGFALTSVDGTIVDYVVPLEMDSWVDKTIDDVVAALKAGAYMNVVGASNNNFATTPEVRVYNASIVMLDDTDREKALRVRTPDDVAYVEQHVYEDTTRVSDLVASHTVYADFIVKEVPDEAAASGFTQQIYETSGATGTYNPGTLYVQLSADLPILNFFDHTGTSVETAPLTLNLWYQIQVDSEWDRVYIKVYDRSNKEIILEHEDVFNQSPNVYAKHGAGMVGT